MKQKSGGIKRLMEFTGKHRGLLTVSRILSGISSVFILGPFLCVYFAARDLVGVFAGTPLDTNSLVRWGLLALGLELIGLVLYFSALLCSHVVAFHTEKNLKMAALKHLAKMPMGYFDANPSGKLRKIIDDNSFQTETFIAHQLPDLVGAQVTMIVSLVLMLVFDWRVGIPLLLLFGKLVLELQNDALGDLLADARRGDERFLIARDDGHRQSLRRADRKDRKRRLRPNARNADELLEAPEFTLRCKTIEVEDPLSDMQISVKFSCFTHLKLCDRRAGGLAGIAHAAAVDHGKVRLHMGDRSADIIKHKLPLSPAQTVCLTSPPLTRLKSDVALRAWQMAMASASAASSGRGTALSFKRRLTMSMTCLFSARPYPTTACLTCMGVYS